MLTGPGDKIEDDANYFPTENQNKTRKIKKTRAVDDRAGKLTLGRHPFADATERTGCVVVCFTSHLGIKKRP
jgi:hypothetical protein